MSHPQRHRVRALLAPVLGLALGLTLAGCGGGPSVPQATAPSPSSTPSPSPEDQPVVVSGISADDLDVNEVAPTGTLGSGLSYGSPIYSVTTTTPPSGPVRVTLELNNALPPGIQVMVGSRPGSGRPWTYARGRLTSDSRHVVFRAKRLTDFTVFLVDNTSALTTFRDDVRARLKRGLDLTALAPTCTGQEDAAAQGYTVGATSKQRSVYFCLGMEKDKPVLRVANRRLSPVQIVHTKAPLVRLDSKLPDALAAWSQVLGTDDTLLADAGGATYDVTLKPTQHVVLSAASPSQAQAMQVVQAVAGALTVRLRRAHAGKADVVTAMKSLLARPACVDALDKDAKTVLAACFAQHKLVKTYGSRGLLLTPLVSAATTQAFLDKQLTAIKDSVSKHVEMNIVVKRAKPDFSAFVGTFTGTDRSMVISDDGIVLESVSNGTTKVADLTYQLANPLTQDGVSTADATITKAKIYDRQAFRTKPPRVGDTGRVKLVEGVIRSPFVKRNYCDPKAGKKGTCS